MQYFRLYRLYFFVPFLITLFDCVAEMSEKYAFIDWVAPNEWVDYDGNRARKKKLKPCGSSDPNKRQRATLIISLQVI